MSSGTNTVFRGRVCSVSLILALLTADTVGGRACVLYPIALPATVLSQVTAGAELNDLMEGGQPGNFGWLTWAGSPSTPTLVGSLTVPGDSQAYVNPDNPGDHVVSVGDWVQGKPGVSNSKKVRDALDALTQIEITVLVWDETRGQGEHAAYRVSGFARVRLISYQLPKQNRITARFLGWVECGTLNQPPAVDAGPDANITLPATVALHGVVADDGLPAGETLSQIWSVVSGPGDVAFGDSTAPVTTASFSLAGTYLLRLTASDSELTASDETLVVVNRENHPPVARNQAVSTDEDTPLRLFLEGDDPDGDRFTTRIVNLPPHGTLSGEPPEVTYTPLADYNGQDSFTFLANDGQLDSALATVAITVRPVNDAPTADPQSLLTDEDTPLSLHLSGADIEGSPLTFSVLTPPAHGTLESLGTDHRYLPALNFHGTDRFTYACNDGVLTSPAAAVTITVLSVDDAPVVTAGPDQLISLPADTVALDGTVDDADFIDGQAIGTNWSMLSGPGTVTFSDSHSVISTATFSASGVYVLRLTADDGFFADSDDVVITVNHPPVVSAGSPRTNNLPAAVTLSGSAFDDGLPTDGTLTIKWSQVSGPGTVHFSDANITNTTVQFSQSGIYLLRLTASDGAAATAHDVAVLANLAPIVDAGSDRTNNASQLTLEGTVADDGMPPDVVPSLFWTKVSGPGEVAFDDPGSPRAVPTFTASGIYTLRLSAHDTLATNSDEVMITVNAAPVVTAGADQSIELPQEASLRGSVTDDGLPTDVPLQVSWTVQSGSGDAVFGDPVSPTTTVRFTHAGVYVLRLAATDSLLEGFDDVMVAVLPPNGPPLVHAGQNQLVLLNETLSLLGWVVDDGLPLGGAVSARWTKASGPGDVIFSDPTRTNTTVTFTAAGNYVLRLTASDTELSNFAEVTLAVRTSAMNEAPAVDTGTDRVVGLTNTVTLTANVTDDGLPRGVPLAVEWSLVGGPGMVQFTDARAPVTEAAFSALGTYVLRLTASDSDRAGSDVVRVTVFPFNHPPVVDAGPDQSIVIPDPAILLSDGSMPADPKAILSRSLLAAPRWNQAFGNPGLSGLPVNAVNAWVTRNGLDVDRGVLYVTGTFTNAGGIYAKSAARFDGTDWSNFYDPNPVSDLGGGHGGGTTGGIVGWLVYDCAPGDFCNEFFGCVAARNGEVFVGGTLYKDLDGVDFLKDCSDRWANGRWRSWGFKRFEGIPRIIKTGTGLVYLAGNVAFQPTNTAYETFTDLPVSYGVAAWDGTNWLTLGDGIRDFRDGGTASTNPLRYNLFYTDLTSLAVGKTSEVYAAGEFIMSTPFGYATNIARWDGQHWRPLGSGISGNGAGLHMISMAVADDGNLYVGGSFTNAGGLYARRVARWDGVQWHTLGSGPFNGVNSSVESIVTCGRDVYLGGAFTEAGGLAVNRIVKWNGEFWSPLGAGATNGVAGGVFAIDADETGLYVGGMFTSAGGFAATNLAKWEFAPPPERDVLLAGRVTDDGLPADAALTMQWTKVSGPGDVTFTHPGQAVTRARFSALGTYVLRLTADDSDLTALDEVTVTVRGNEPPVVDAGPDQVLGLSEAAVLTAAVSDDGLPENAGLPFVWSVVNGPGAAIFGNQNATNTTVRFTKTGSYVLRLTANDSQFSAYDDVVITVANDNQPPYGHPGSSRTVAFGVPATFSTVSLSDDGKPLNVTNILWSQLSGPGIVNFDNPTGKTTTVTFSLPGSYVIRLLVNDTELASYIDANVTVTLGNNASPVVNAGPDQTNSTLTTTLRGIVSDDGLPEAAPLRVYWTKYGGPGDARFADSNAPATGVTFSKVGNYTLRLTAFDGVYSRYDDTVVYMPNQPPLVNAGPDRTIITPTMSLALTGSANDDGQSYAVPSPTWARVSGPGTVTFSTPYAYTNTATFSTTGTYVLSLSAYDGYVRSTGFVTIVVAPPGNLPPTVEAGPDAVLVWPATNLTLSGSVADDGLPAGSSASAIWTKVSGPGDVSLVDPTAPQTTATFDLLGEYVLRLIGTDSALVNGDDVVIQVKPAVNAPPLVEVGPPQTMRLTNALVLTGMVADDGLPLDTTLAVNWQKLSGPGPVYFVGATNISTNLHTVATFEVAGNYVLRLTANDSELRASADLAVSVLPTDDNLPPVVNAGPDFSAPTCSPQLLLGSVTDDGRPEDGFLAVAWNQVAGPGRVYFGKASALDSTASFYVTGVYVLRLTATDGCATHYDDVTVTVTPAPNEPPFVYAGEDLTVVRPQPARLAAAVFDDNLPIGYPLTYEWTQVSGPGAATLVPAGGAVTNLYVDALATFSATGTYVLRLTAADGEFTDFDLMTVTVLPGTNAPPEVSAGPDFAAVLSEPARLQTEASDDGLEEGLLEISWTQVSGPGAAYFSTINGVYQASFTDPGEYVLRLTASDHELSASDEVTVTVHPASDPPLAQILSPVDAASITAPAVITGTVSSEILQSWTLEYRLKPPGADDSLAPAGGEGQGEGDGSMANTQSPSLNSQWTTLATGSTELTADPLATFDPTLLLNGIYELRLTATDLVGRTSTTEPVTVVVERNMKLGHFTLSFSDLTIPVAGIPITVVRTYDSRDKQRGDFGIGWTLDLKNVRLQKNRHLGRAWDQTSTGSLLPTYCIDTVKPRLVTVTFPDGRVHKFRAVPVNANTGEGCQALVPLIYPTMRFLPLDNTRGSLEPVFFHHRTGERLVDSQLVFASQEGIPGRGDFVSWELLLDPPPGAADNILFNPDLFEFTTPEGYRYLISETNGLRSVADPNGNTLTLTPGGITWTNAVTGGTGLTVAFQRDDVGRITNIVDALGHAMTYSYDTNGDLVTFTDRAGQTNLFAYADAPFPHHLTAVIDARGLTVLQNEYDFSGRIVATLDAVGNRISFENDLAHLRQVVTNRLGFVTLKEFDVFGRLIQRTDPNGLVTTYRYDQSDNLVTVSNSACGCATHYAYDANDNLMAETDELGRTVSFTYSPLNKVVTHTDADGNTTTNSYDDRGNLLSTCDPLGGLTRFTYTEQGQVASMTDPRGGVSRFEYDHLGRLTNELNALGHPTSYTVDNNGQLLSVTRRRTLDFAPPATARFDGPGQRVYCSDPPIARHTNIVVTYTYDDAGRLISALLPDGSTIGNAYNQINRVSASTNQLGEVTTTFYNELGKPARITYADGTQELMEYDAEGQLVTHRDRGSRATGFSYDPGGRLTRVTYPDGRSVNASYDASGHLIAETDAIRGSTTYTHDAVGNRISSTDPLGNTTRYTYNSKRACTSVTDPLSRVAVMDYDALNRNTRILLPDGATKAATYSGRLITSITDELERTRSFTYDLLGRLVGVTNASGDVVRFEYDELDNRVLEIDAAGEITSHEYDNLGRRIRTVLPDGATHEFEYDPLGRLTTSIDASGRITRYAYDSRNNLLAVTNAFGEVTRSSYNVLGQRTSLTDALGQTTEWRYDEAGRLTAAHHADGSSEVTEYDGASRIAAVIDRAGGRTSYDYDALDRVVTITDPLNQTTAFSYDAVGNLLRDRDPAGQVTQFIYDNRNRRTGLVLPDGTVLTQTYDPCGRVASRSDALGNITRYGYDANGRLTAVTNALGQVMRYAYDSRGNLASSVGALGEITTCLYDENGRRTQTIQPDGAAELIAYDARGLIGSRTDALGRVSRFGYDDLGRLISLTNALGHVTHSAYDSLGRLTNQTDAKGHVTTFHYDTAGRVTNTIYADGTSASAAYDTAGRLVAETDARGNTTFYGYDLLGRMTNVTNALGEVTTFAYDSLGRRTEIVDALNRTNRFVYDAVGRLTHTIHADGTIAATVYDTAGRRIASIDEAGVTNFFGYDSEGRLTSVTNALGGVTRYEYDAAGNLTAETDANGHTTIHRYDSMRRRTGRTLPGGESEEYGYDRAGNLIHHTDFNGRVTTYEYDALDRLVRKTPDPSFGAPPVTWAYDAVGLRTRMTDAAGATDYRYDNRNRLVEKSRIWPESGATAMLRYSYDAAGNVTGVTSASVNGAALGYGYDPLNRLQTVQDPLNGATGYSYDPVGNLASVTRPNGLQTHYLRDARDRATNVTTIDGSASVLSQYVYTHAPAGNRVTASEALVTGGQVSVWTNAYAYDRLYRLAREIVGGTGFADPAAIDYAYDAVGNRLTRSTSGSAPGALDNQSFSYDANDRLNTDLYDANGNTLLGAGFAQTEFDRYDFENRLVERRATLNSQPSTITLQYDGDGNRVSKTVNGVTTHFLVDELNPSGWPQVLEEQTWNPADPMFSVPAVTRVYSYGHAPLAQDQLTGGSWTASHFMPDAHGNVCCLTDGAGQVTDTFAYDAFGNLMARGGSTPTTRLYTGEEFDPDLGLYHLRARYHNPGTGRFWTRDGFEGFAGDPGSRHPYAYVQNDPVNRIDPSGHHAMWESLAVSAVAIDARHAANALWGGINYYLHGLGGGEELKAKGIVEAMFIQGLSQHVGINLGRRNFWETAMGAPFLLVHNPNVFFLRDDCYRYEVLGFDPDAPIYGCPNREPVFTFDFENSRGCRTALDLFEPLLAMIDIPSSGFGTLGDYEGYSQIFRDIFVNTGNYDADELRVDLVSGTGRSALAAITVGGSELAFNAIQGNWDEVNTEVGLAVVAVFGGRVITALDGELVAVRGAQQLANVNRLRNAAQGNRAARAYSRGFAGDGPRAPTPPRAVSAPQPCLNRTSGSACFVAGTLVATEEGLEKIEEVQAGDRVWSRDMRTGEWRYANVERTFRHEYEGDIVSIEADGETIEATGNHPFWVVEGADLATRNAPDDVPVDERASETGGRWVEARGLQVGDELLASEADRVQVDGISRRQAGQTVYNLQVEGIHTYAVSSGGVLVHNKAMQVAPVPVEGGGWMLPDGAIIRGGRMTVTTPYGPAVQELTPEALALLRQIENGATVYKGGFLGRSEAGASQFLAVESPLNPGYASRYGIPPENARFDFVLTGRIRRGAPLITRPAPPVPPNPGGSLEGVTSPGSFTIDSFYMP